MTRLRRIGMAMAAGFAVLTGAWPAGAGVFAHYTFDTDYVDASGNGWDGTLVDIGTTGDSGITTDAGAWKFGGGGLNLSADRDYVSVTSKTFSSGVPYSIAFWARKAPGDTGDPVLWDMAIGQRDNANFFIGLNNGTGIRWRSSSTATNRQADFTAPDDTEWHHHVITADNAGTIAYYLDGSWVASSNNLLTGFIVDTIGEAYSTARDFDFHGQLDEVWIFDETLSAASVSNLFLYNVVTAVVNTNRLVLHYRFDGDFSDSSGSGNHGTASGAAAPTADPASVPVGSGALLLDGQDSSYVTLSTPLQFASNGTWTVAFWAQRAEIGSQKGMILGERFTTDDFLWLNDSFTGLRFRSSANTTMDFTAAQDVARHHYALVADGAGALSFYRDGSPVQTLSGNTSFRIDTVGQAYTTSSLHYGFNGVLDEVRVYQVALTDPEVLALYHEGAASSSVVTRVRVFLQGGQSNGDGRADPAGLPVSPVNLQQPQPDVDYYYRVEGGAGVLTTLRPGTSETSQFGPEITFGRDIADLLGGDPQTRIAVVKYANGGTSLSVDWKAGGDATTTGDGPEYVAFQQTVADGLAALVAKYTGAVVQIEGMTWMQGESDASPSASAAYAANLQAFLADLRATFGADLPFVIARLSSGQTALDAAGLATLRAAQAQVAAADPWTSIVDTDSFPLQADELHFNAAGQQLLGSAFAARAGYLEWMPGRFSPAQIAAGLAEETADADGDGSPNEAEFGGGTEATNALSYLWIDLKATAPGSYEVSYPGATNRLFCVEAASNLAAGGWTEFLPAAPGTGGTVTRSMTNPAGRSFLRVKASLP